MTSTDRMSSRLGTVAPSVPGLHEGAELVEQARRVVRPRGGFRVVLDAEGRGVQHPEPFDHAVVQVDMTDPGPAEGGLELTIVGHRDGEAMVVAGDLDPATLQV